MDNDLKILYIPSFSPQLNPTEIIFNMMKYDTRREKPRNLEQLKSMLEHCVGKIDKNDMLFIFEDLDGCIRRAEDKREIN